MSEKRFKFYSDDYLVGIIDTATGKKLNHFATIDLLNEQQATISALKEENDGIKTKGLDVLAFYESKLKDVVGTEDFQCVRDEIWIVRQVLYEMGVIDDE